MTFSHIHFEVLIFLCLLMNEANILRVPHPARRGRPLANDLTLWGLTSYLAKMLAEKVTLAQANEYASLPHGYLCIDWILTFGRLLAASSTTL